MEHKEFITSAEVVVGFSNDDSVYTYPRPLVLPTDVVGRRITKAWYDANELSQQMDTNSRTSLLWMFIDPSCPTWRRERILAVQAWWQAVWTHYAGVKQSILAGNDTSFDSNVPGPCPWTIWQISGDAP